MTLRTLALAATLALTACGGKNPGAYETLGKADTTARSGAQDAADALWANRNDVTQLKAAIAAYEKLAQAEPSNRHAHVHATRGWYFLADAWTEDPDEQIALYEKAIEWGKRCMALNASFADRVNGGEKEKDVVDALTKDDVPCAYWTASALGKWAKANGIAKSIKYLPTVKAYIGRAEELDPTYFYNGPARYWGAYYSVIPSFAGRDLDKSAAYFKDTIAASPGYLGSRVLRAENLAVGLQDVKMFDDDLKYVIEFDASTVPDLLAENQREQAKAKKIQAMRGDLFDKKALEAAGE